MRLIDLFEETEITMASPQATRNMAARQAMEVTGLSADSRRIEPGHLFAALPGSRHDGRDFIDSAVERGAIAVLAPPGTSLRDHGRPVALITDENPRRRLALLAARFYRRQPRRIAAVTGTNGKTSVAEFTRQIWQAQGLAAASLGTLGLIPPSPSAPASLTTPDPVELQHCLAALAMNDVDHLALEASSHGLDQYRLDGVEVGAAAFTNLSRDHLDYHGGMGSYFAAKQRLFAELLPAGGTAVLNADAEEYPLLAEIAAARGHEVVDYGSEAKALRLLARAPQEDGQSIEIEVFGKRHAFHLPLAGAFQAHNVLCALGLATATGAETEAAVEALAGLDGVPGRLELVGRTPRGGAVYVDYAHTPGALETLLTALRPHTKGRLSVVFGAGGDRDRGKRPMMGEVTRRAADRIVVTDDNPRGEEPASIRRAILAAVPEAQEIGDRAAAIRFAVGELGPGDVLAVAGKGHESGQTVGDQVLPFDDREVARAAIAELLERRP